jgi:hypothetical protein
MVRPVHQPAQLVPFVHTSKLDAITHADWHTFRQVDVVRDQQSVVIA